MTSTATPKKRVARKPAAKKTAAKPAPARPKIDTTQDAIVHVPDPSIIEQYVNRSFKLSDTLTMTDMELFDFCYENEFNLLIEGPTGPGKTMATKTWCAMKGMRLARIPSFSGVEPSMLFGKYNPDKQQGGFTWIDGQITHVVRHGGCILVNEVNFLPERIATVLFGLLDGNREIVLLDHEGEVIRAHRGAGKCWCDLAAADCDSRRIIIVADMNPDYLGTRELNIAFRNRWGMKVQWDYDPAVEEKLVASPTLRLMSSKLRQQVVKDQMIETPVSTNMLIEFEKIAKSLSVDFAIENFVNAFRAEEREAVKLICDAFKARLADDLTEKEEPTPVKRKGKPVTAPDSTAPASSTPAASTPASADPVMANLADWVYSSTN